MASWVQIGSFTHQGFTAWSGWTAVRIELTAVPAWLSSLPADPYWPRYPYACWVSWVLHGSGFTPKQWLEFGANSLLCPDVSQVTHFLWGASPGITVRVSYWG